MGSGHLATISGSQPLLLSAILVAQMRSHVSREAPLEACGLLAGIHDRVETIFEITNAERSPVRFRMNPQEQFDAFMRIESLGQELLGIYHSHPNGPATVSATDIADAAYPAAHLLWFCENDEWLLRAFWIESGRAIEIALQIDL